MPNPPKGSLPDPVIIKTHLKKLSDASSALNTLSDGLTKVIGELESRINAFGLGVPAAVKVIEWDIEDHSTETWWLKYGKLQTSKRWGLIIECVIEDQIGDMDSEIWAFKDAPREERIRAVSKLPELFEALEKRAAEIAEGLSAQISYAQSLVLNLSESSNEHES